MATRQQGTRRAPKRDIVRSVRFPDAEDFRTIAAAAKREAVPFAVFLRSAALREARRILPPTAA